MSRSTCFFFLRRFAERGGGDAVYVPQGAVQTPQEASQGVRGEDVPPTADPLEAVAEVLTGASGVRGSTARWQKEAGGRLLVSRVVQHVLGEQVGLVEEEDGEDLVLAQLSRRGLAEAGGMTWVR
jgi:hypothetical protein